jgi:hypothetical protein
MTSRSQRTQPIRSAWHWKLGGAAVILILAAALSIAFFSGAEKTVELLIDFQQYHYGAVPEEFDYDATGSSASHPAVHSGDHLDALPRRSLSSSRRYLAEPDHYPVPVAQRRQKM